VRLAALKTFSNTSFNNRLQLVRPDRLRRQRIQDTRNRDGRCDRDRDPGVTSLVDLPRGKTQRVGEGLWCRSASRTCGIESETAPLVSFCDCLARVSARDRLGDTRAGMEMAGVPARGLFFSRHMFSAENGRQDHVALGLALRVPPDGWGSRENGCLRPC
jgi:hypothetical protein